MYSDPFFNTACGKLVPVVRMEHLAGTKARARARLAATFLARDARVELVYLFGSAADETRMEVRDVDLAVLCNTPITMDELMRLRAGLVAAAGGDVDLVSLSGASVVLAKEIADTGRCLFARSPDAEAEFVTRARFRYWDFKPFLDEQWRLAGRRLEERTDGPET